MGFIRSETVKFIHTAPEDGHEDELSIAMLAFYESILNYEKSRGAFSLCGPGYQKPADRHYRTEKRHGPVISLHARRGTRREGICSTKPSRNPRARNARSRAAPWDTASCAG